jgi:hypothetical protein
MQYRTLDPACIIDTAERLQERVEARFPQSGLRGVSAELVSLSRDLAQSARLLERPIWWLRAVTAAAVIAGATLFIFVGTILPFDRFVEGGAAQSVQGIEASINTLLLAGFGLLGLLRAEQGIKRKRVFRDLHSLRSLIHVIDMHQLTKDPTIVLQGAHPTAASPQRSMTQFELTRYLDYCAEMLALIGKLAALYAEHMCDGVVIDAVNDIENLTSGLGRKIWQKITIISALQDKVDAHARD